jgi:hypothetical protein
MAASLSRLARIVVLTNLPDGQNWREHADRLDALEAEAKKQRLRAWAGR